MRRSSLCRGHGGRQSRFLAVDMVSGDKGVKGFEEGSAFGELCSLTTWALYRLGCSLDSQTT